MISFGAHHYAYLCWRHHYEVNRAIWLGKLDGLYRMQRAAELEVQRDLTTRYGPHVPTTTVRRLIFEGRDEEHAAWRLLQGYPQ